MQQTATETLPALTEEDALYWRIYAPKTHRLDVGLWNPREDGDRPLGDSPRLWLMDTCDGYGPDMDTLNIVRDSSLNREEFEEARRTAYETVKQGMDARAGTWRRYLLDISFVRAFVKAAGWTLTAEEQALMDALEAKMNECPAWVRERIGQAAYAA